MKLYTNTGKTIIVDQTMLQMVEIMKNEFDALSNVFVNTDSMITIVFKRKRGESKYAEAAFLEILDMFPELFLNHAFNGLSGNSFELALR